jgi:hypothetical protein
MNVLEAGGYQLWCTDDGKPYELMARTQRGSLEPEWRRVWAHSYKWASPDRPLGEGNRYTHVLATFGYEWRTDSPEGPAWYRREYQGGDIILRRDTRGSSSG